MPQHLDQPTRAAPEHVEITAMRVATQPLLHQQRQTLHALAHVRVARGEPHPHAAGQRDHRSALSAAATRAAGADGAMLARAPQGRSEEHTSELQSLMRISYAVFCLKKQTKNTNTTPITKHIDQK